MDRERIEHWCERCILVLVLAIMVFAPLATGAVRMVDFLVVQALTIGVMLFWLLRLWVAYETKLLFPPFCWAVLAFAGYAIARYATCDLEYVGRQELLRVLVYSFLFFAILNNLHRQESIRIISYSMVFLAMGISCYAIYQFITGSDRVWNFISPYKGRAGGTYICPNHLGGFLEMLLPLALGYTLVGRGKPVTKIMLGYAALMMIAGLGATISRGSWGACTVALLLMFLVLALNRSYRVPSMVMMVLLIGGSTFFILKTEMFKERWRRTFSSGPIELDTRYQMWQATVRMWRDHFWFGVGPGHFDYRWRFYRPVDIQLRADRAHNEYLNILADWGTLGAGLVAAALLLLLLGVVKSWKHVRRAETDFGGSLNNKFAFQVGAAAGLFALLIHSTVDFNMQIPANAILAVALMALLNSQLRFSTDRYWVSLPTVTAMIVTGVLVSGIGVFGVLGIRAGRESYWLRKAEAASYRSPEQRSFYERAYAAEPKNFETTQAIGETYRLQSWEGADDYGELATNAIIWFARGKVLNPFDGYNYLYSGMCLDWVKRQIEARPEFIKADELDPNGYFTTAMVGWHFIQEDNYGAARPWFERSLRLKWTENDVAEKWLPIANRKLAEVATNAPSLFPR